MMGVLMRVVIAMFKHETNTFSPVPTPLERFGDGGPYWGEAALAQYRNTNTPTGAFIDLAEARGAEIATPVAGEAWPSGRVADDAFEKVAGAILAEVDAGCDVLLLDLHGAMATESLDDGEGALLQRLREAHPELPIAVALDLHANVTDAMVRNATAIAGFKTYPHVDMYATGERVGRVVLDAADGACVPRMAWGNRPMIPHIMRQGTDESPMRDLIRSAEGLEAEGALAASVFGGFPHADIRDAGLSAIVVTDGRMDRAEGGCARLLDEAWAAREAFVYRSEPLAEAVARAKALADGPVLLLDHCDNCGSGGTQDVMTVIEEVLRQELDDVVVFAVHDPDAVSTMIAAGVGAEVTVPLGGKYAMPSIGLDGRPLDVTGRVQVISDGGYTIQGPMYTGVFVSMGRAVVLNTGRARIVVIERHHEPWDVGCLTSLGIDPMRTRYTLLKSRVHWRAGFWPLARHVIDLAGDGVTTSDYTRLTFDKLRRPIYPLDSNIDIAPDV